MADEDSRGGGLDRRTVLGLAAGASTALAGCVDLGADAEVFLEYLSHEPAPEPVELQYYLGIALAGGSLFAATRVMGMGMLSDVAVVSMILCVGGLAVYHPRLSDSDASA